MKVVEKKKWKKNVHETLKAQNKIITKTVTNEVILHSKFITKIASCPPKLALPRTPMVIFNDYLCGCDNCRYPNNTNMSLTVYYTCY